MEQELIMYCVIFAAVLVSVGLKLWFMEPDKVITQIDIEPNRIFLPDTKPGNVFIIHNHNKENIKVFTSKGMKVIWPGESKTFES